MRLKDISEGGWASTLTQNTVITPATVKVVVEHLQKFEGEFNSFLSTHNIPLVKIGNPAGSTTYYKRDLQVNPQREYGDIDVNLFIPQNKNLTPNTNFQVYKTKIKEFCDASLEYKTDNGTNVILRINDKDYVQIDFIMSFDTNRDWSNVLAPAYNVKGVLSSSLYSSLAEALNLSFNAHGIQVKLQDNVPVSFKIMKNVELKTITNNRKTWAVDIVKFFKCKRLDPLLQQYAGMGDEVRVPDIVNSIIGIAKTLELNGKGKAVDLLDKIASIYSQKIQKAIDSSKFDKAASPAAIEKAKHTKEMLSSKLKDISELLRSYR